MFLDLVLDPLFPSILDSFPILLVDVYIPGFLSGPFPFPVVVWFQITCGSLTKVPLLAFPILPAYRHLSILFSYLR